MEAERILKAMDALPDIGWNEHGSPSLEALAAVLGEPVAQADVDRAIASLPPPEKLGRESHDDLVRGFEEALDHARARKRAAERAVTDARAAMARAITAWQAAHPPISPEQNAREEIRRSQERKTRIALGEEEPAPGPTPGPSLIDRIAAAAPRGVGAFRRLPSRR